MVMGKPDDFIKNNTSLLLSLIAIVAIIIRLLPISKVVTNGVVHTIGFDSYYHMRRIFYTAQHFPNSITFDSYLNYPYGLEIGWPLLFDQVAALLALLNGLGSPDPVIIQYAAAILPLLLGIITFISLYYVTSLIANKNIALLSVALLAVLPTNIDFSMFGFVDHHIAEILLSTSMYAFFIAALKDQKLSFREIQRGIKKKKFEKSTAMPMIYSACAGVLIAVSFLTWIGALIFISILVIYAVVQFTIDLKKGTSSEHVFLVLILTFMVALILIAPILLMSVRPGLELSPVHLSLFQVFFTAAMILFVLILNTISKLVKSRDFAWWGFPLILTGSTFTGFLALSIFYPSMFQSMMFGITYLIGGGYVLGTISEAQPLFSLGMESTFVTLYASYGVSFILAFLAFVIFIKKMVKENYPSEMLFFTVWTIIILILTLFQRRFINELSINVVILASFLMITIFTVLNPGKNTKTRSWRIAGIVLLILILFVPNVYIGYLKATHPQVPPSDWIESLEWMKENTPPTSYYDDPAKIPEYGVMSWWSYGNWIVYLAQRPVVTNNFQTGMEDSARFFIESNVTKATSILDSRNVRYIITSDELVLLKNRNVALIAGEEPDNYGMSSDKLKGTSMWLLQIGDGSGTGFFRLIHESETAQIFPNIKSVKIFEYVSGANIIGQATPNEVVLAYTNITTNQNRVFTYYNGAITNETGWYNITVAYPTSRSAFSAGHVEPYKIINSTSVFLREVSVSEDDVVNGRNVH